jgi:signal transduction histidine kinase/DNA-binding NarL/FixJ family response regulator
MRTTTGDATGGAVSRADARIRRLTVELRDRDLEGRFAAWSWQDVSGRARRAVAIATLCTLAFAYADVLFLGVTVRLVPPLVARLSVAVFGAVVVAETYRPERRIRFDPLQTAWTAWTAAVVVYLATTRPTGYLLHALITTVALLAIYLLMPLRFVAAATIAIAMTVAYTAAVVLPSHAGYQALVSTVFTLVFSNAFGVSGSRWHEQLRRVQFLKIVDAEQANEAKSLFLATISHEVRTPLHGLLTCARLLIRSELSSVQRRRAEIIRECGEGMLRLLDEILDLSSVEARALVLDEGVFDPSGLVAGVAELTRPRAESLGLALVVATPPLPAYLFGDAGRIRQVLLNLVDNAMKFTSKGAITLGARPLETGGSRARLAFSVKDTGPGVPEVLRQAIFEPFVRGHHGATVPGKGLGLAICKRLVEAMGGSITLRGGGEGSEFEFVVDLRPADGPIHRAPPPHERGASARTVLVADDDDVSRELSAALLAGDGHDVTAVKDGAEALAALQTRSFDVAILDVHMPVLDGCDVARRLAARRGRGGAPTLVALTASAMSHELDAFRASGFDHVLAKPLNVDELLSSLTGAPRRAGEPSRSSPSLVDAALVEQHRTVLGAKGLARLRSLFAATSQDILAGIEQAVRRGDRAAAARFLHRLASAASSVGFAQLAAQAASMEETSKTGLDASLEDVGALAGLREASIRAGDAAGCEPGERDDRAGGFTSS